MNRESKPLKKAIRYMRKMINCGKWKTNYSIPTLKTISSTLNICPGTVRKGISILEGEKMLENNGSLGFIVIPQSLTALYHTNKQAYYLRTLTGHINSLHILDRGGVILGRYIILKLENSLEIYDVVTASTILTTVHSLKESITNPIQISDLVNLTGPKLQRQRQKYLQHTKLKVIAKLLLKDKGLNLC